MRGDSLGEPSRSGTQAIQRPGEAPALVPVGIRPSGEKAGSATCVATSGEGGGLTRRTFPVAQFEDWWSIAALYQATGEVEIVKRTGRWSSGAVHRYLHDSGDVLKGLSERMAAVDQFVHYT